MSDVSAAESTVEPARTARGGTTTSSSPATSRTGRSRLPRSTWRPPTDTSPRSSSPGPTIAWKLAPTSSACAPTSARRSSIASSWARKSRSARWEATVSGVVTKAPTDPTER